MKMLWKLGTRGSALALTQSGHVADQLRASHPESRIELVVIKTSGDLNQRDPLSQMGGKGVFVKEIETALLDGSIDFAVHSLKDMPSLMPAGLTLAPPPERADPRDALVGPAALMQVATGAAVGTGSLRRQVQLRALRPDLSYVEIRGNVPTRVEKWRNGTYPGGVVLACAGLRRLGEQSGAASSDIHALSVEECVPAPCQGVLGLQYRQDDEETRKLLAAVEHRPTALAAQAERAFLAALGGDCNLPAGGYATVHGERMHFRGVLWREERLQHFEAEAGADAACELGVLVAQTLLQR
jgi:hydroxymethylbilane synthase